MTIDTGTWLIIAVVVLAVIVLLLVIGRRWR